MLESQEQEISNLLLEYSAGNYSAKGKITSNNDEVDMIIAGINMLGEELSETNISKNFFSSVFNAVNDLIFILSPEGKIKDINKSVLKAFNCSTSIVNGEFLSDFLNIEDALSEKIKNRLSKNNKPYSKELLISMKEGSDIIGLVTYSNIVNRFGEFEGYLVNIKDITKSKNTEKLILKNTITTQQQEHARIADDLHDSLGQELSMVKLMVSNLDKYSDIDKRIAKILNTTREILDDSIANLRQICFDLMPSVLIKGGLSLAIEEFIHKLNSQNIIKFKYKKVSEIPKFNKDLEIMLYRLVQEFINNSMKHSEAKNVSLLLDFSYNSELNLIIEDDGKGFDIDELDDRDDGRGVNNIKTKVLAFDGEHQLESAIGEGTKLTLKFKNPKLR